MKSYLSTILKLNTALVVSLFGIYGSSEDDAAITNRSADQQLSLKYISSPNSFVAFPNYFKYLLKENHALYLINRAMHSIIPRLEVPYVNSNTGKMVNKGFFESIQQLVDQKAPGSKVYIAGGMVRSLLSYIYKKIYNADMREQANLRRPLDDRETERLIEETFDRIINGKRHYGRDLFKEDESPKSLSTLKALGVGSDYDILIDFPNDFAKKEAVIDEVTNFINSAERQLGLRNNKDELKKSIVPVGDVKDYQEQFGVEGDQSAVRQGGSTLDWLAFPLSQTISTKGTVHDFRMPEGHQDILDNFLNGYLQYLAPKSGVELRDPDKQTIRGLRALLEILFLRFDPASAAQMAKELKTLIEHSSAISNGAKEQLIKMIRNARSEAAHNRFNSSIPCMPDGELTALIKQLNRQLPNDSKSLPAIPEFVKNKKIAGRSDDKGNLTEKGILLPIKEFIEKYTTDGVVYHGTPEIQNVLFMIRNGLVLSSNTSESRQGVAAHGTGFYTDKSRAKPQNFAGDKGTVIPIKIKKDPKVRILDLNTDKGKEFFESVKKEYPDQDSYRILTDDYDIDIVVSEGASPYPLIENADAVIIDKDIKALLEIAINKAKEEIKRNQCTFTTNFKKWVEYLLPDRGYTALMLMMDPNYSKEEGIALLENYCAQLWRQENNRLQYAAMFCLELKDSAYCKDISDAAKLLFNQGYQKKSGQDLPDNLLAFIASNIASDMPRENFTGLLAFCHKYKDKKTLALFDATNDPSVIISRLIEDILTASDTRAFLQEMGNLSLLTDIGEVRDLLPILDMSPVSKESLRAINSVRPFKNIGELTNLLSALDRLTKPVPIESLRTIHSVSPFKSIFDVKRILPTFDNLQKPVSIEFLRAIQNIIPIKNMTALLPILDQLSNPVSEEYLRAINSFSPLRGMDDVIYILPTLDQLTTAFTVKSSRGITESLNGIIQSLRQIISLDMFFNILDELDIRKVKNFLDALKNLKNRFPLESLRAIHNIVPIKHIDGLIYHLHFLDELTKPVPIESLRDIHNNIMKIEDRYELANLLPALDSLTKPVPIEILGAIHSILPFDDVYDLANLLPVLEKLTKPVPIESLRAIHKELPFRNIGDIEYLLPALEKLTKPVPIESLRDIHTGVRLDLYNVMELLPVLDTIEPQDLPSKIPALIKQLKMGETPHL